MGTTPVIRVKGMSRLQYIFQWDKDCRHYAYEPKDQREADDIFRTQGRLYKRMFFSVLMDEKKEPVKQAVESDHHFIKEEPKKELKEEPKKELKKEPKKEPKKELKKSRVKAKPVLQAVEEEATTE